jgi:ABC-type sugar transport system ATPase subunit
MSSESVLELEHVTEHYGEKAALADFSLSVQHGEIHGVLGDNGAGKTTLLKILSGMEKSTRTRGVTGVIKVNGIPVKIVSPLEAAKHGIGIVPRRPGIFTGLTVADNVVIGKQMQGLIIHEDRMQEQASALMEMIGLRLNPVAKANNLTNSQQRLLMIARALGPDVKVVVMDEPAAFLTTPQDLSQLFRAVRSLAERDIATLYLTRRPAEAVQIADRISVLRDGEIVSRWLRADFDESSMIQQMQSQRIGDEGYVDYDDLNQRRGWLDGLRSWLTGDRS